MIPHTNSQEIHRQVWNLIQSGFYQSEANDIDMSFVETMTRLVLHV